MHQFDDYVILVLPDHPTPIENQDAHLRPGSFIAVAPKPAVRCRARQANTANAMQKKTGLVIRDGHTLLRMLINK